MDVGGPSGLGGGRYGVSGLESYEKPRSHKSSSHKTPENFLGLSFENRRIITVGRNYVNKQVTP